MMRLITILAAVFTAGCAPALAQDAYPNKPVTVVVTYPAGGPADTVTQMLPNAVVVRADSPARNIRELIAQGESASSTLTYASAAMWR